MGSWGGSKNGGNAGRRGSRGALGRQHRKKVAAWGAGPALGWRLHGKAMVSLAGGGASRLREEGENERDKDAKKIKAPPTCEMGYKKSTTCQ